ncbi:MAG TPA: nucleotidyltransferase domain-containing protein [Thermoanaerobaculia bacterium]|nr:nucleotidyltransferase domain-containing protein [Thermoanaerobaculia bacterium]
MMTRDQIDRIVDFLDRRFGLDTLWLYGSEAQGTAKPDSDVDLAALFRRRTEPLDVFDARTDLEEILHRDVDLVDLDQTSPILGMQVLKYGDLLVDRNPGRRHAAFGRILGLYEDVKLLRRDMEGEVFRRLRQ